MSVAAASLRAPLRAPVAVGAAGAVLAAGLLVRDPHVPGFWPTCPILALTGVPCPGCGGLRATQDLLTGHWGAAVSSNAYAVLTVLLVLGGYAAWLAATVQGRRPRWLDRLPVLTLVWAGGLLLFGAVRLLPALSALRP